MSGAPSMQSTAVLALHYQNDVLHAEGRIRVGFASDSSTRESVIAAAGVLLSGARRIGMPIVHIRIAFRPDYGDLVQNCPLFRETAKIGAVVDGTWGAAFYTGLGPSEANPHEYVVHHLRTSGFVGTPLELILSRLGVRHLIIAGVATHSTVEMTVRHAVDLGYEVTVAADACAAATDELHQASLTNMRLLADISTVEKALEKKGREL